MKLCFRWYGQQDPVTLQHIRQVPGVQGVVSALFDIPVGQVWPHDPIARMRQRVEDAGLKLMGIESVPVHEDIKLGRATREVYLENFCRTIQNLGSQGISVLCYNFMPIFDWMRTDLATPLPDGSTCLSYNHAEVIKINPLSLGEIILPAWVGDFSQARLKELFAAYALVDEERIWDNLAYFLEQVVPVAEQCGVKLGIHPDDPPWPIFGLPRIIGNERCLQRVIDLVDSPANGLSLCSGSLGADPDNDIPRMVRRFGAQGRIHFAHLRNVRVTGDRSFHEIAHASAEEGLDMYEIIKAYHAVGFNGIMRPDHGRAIWGEKGIAGYGLYDRSLGASYILGLWEAVSRG